MITLLLTGVAALAATPPTPDSVSEVSPFIEGSGNCTPEEQAVSVEHTLSVASESWFEIDELTVVATGLHGTCDVYFEDLRVELDGSTIYIEELRIQRGLGAPNILETRKFTSAPSAPSDIEIPRVRLTPGTHTLTVTLDGQLDSKDEKMSVSMIGVVLSGRDWDRDGYDDDELAGGDDCDDSDTAFNPGVDETWYNGEDEDCAGDDDYDQDADGYRAKGEIEGGDDCLDTRADTYPGAPEVWYDGIDQDCGGDNDFDQDGDGFDSPDHGGDDCDDLDGSKYPGARTWDEDCQFTVRTDDSRPPPGDTELGGTGCSRGAPAAGALLLLPWLLLGRRKRARSSR